MSLGQALTSSKAGAVVVTADGVARSFGEHASVAKGKCMYDGLKIHKINFKVSIKIFFRKLFWPHKFRKTSSFGHF